MTCYLSKEIVQTAKKWLHTPFHLQGRVINEGVDCIGLIIGISKELDIKSKAGMHLVYYDQYNYDLNGSSFTMLNQQLNYHFMLTKLINPGVIINFTDKQRSHLGIISSENTYIHSCMIRGMVIEQRIPSTKNFNLWQFSNLK